MKQINHYLLPVKQRAIALLVLLSPVTVIGLHAQSFPAGFSQVEVASGISNPTVMAFAPDGRIFVAQQNGVLHVIKNGVKLSTPALQISVNSSGERGLIGIALHPQFSSNGFIYLYYTLSNASRNRVSRFTMTGDVIAPSSEVVILNLDPLSSATNHNGGAMQFKGGHLYIAVGENANTVHAQNLDTYHGKILRVNSDGSAPTDNPFNVSGASAQRMRVWAYGLRNPYTFDVQPGTGRIFVNDVGQSAWEEINDATTPGLNFGWPATEGATTNPAYTTPVFSYPHGSGDGRGCAITGGVFFNPATTNYPASFMGKYFFQDLCNAWVNYLDLSSGVVRNAFATGLPGQSLALDVGTDGNLYYLSRSAGRLYRIIYTSNTAPAITDQPDDVTVSAGQPASFSVTATGSAPLSYQWRKNNSNIPGATAATFTINSAQPSDAGNYSVVVSNSAGSVTSQTAMLTVSAFNAPPSASITTPADQTIYAGGDVINFSGTATDPEDGTLPASAFTWNVVFHHDDHVHDGPPVAQGTTSGSFTIPATGETSANVFYRLHLVVTDSQGLSDTATVDIIPRTSTITLNSNPAGLTVTLDGQPVATPYSTIGVEGVQRTIGVVSPQTMNGVSYTFTNWSHGGSATQTIITPTDNITYTANYIASGLPSPWLTTDIGNVGVAGSAGFAEGTFTLSGSGGDIWSTADAFRYVYQPVSGNVEIIARVTDIGNTDPWAKAGVMIRETLQSNATHAMVVITPGNGVAFQRRITTGGSSTHTGGSGSAPYWVRLVRNGNVFTGYRSSDGVSWNQVGSVTISMTSNVFVGFPLTSHNNNTLSTATFTNVSVNGLPSPWLTADIGSVGVEGSAGHENGTFTVSGSGSDIWGTSDAFRYMYQPVAGNVEITARVTGISNTNAWAKAGVMIRETLNSNAKHAMVIVTPGNGVAFQRRADTGGSSSHTGSTGSAPYWVRLARNGNVFTALRSADGNTWTEIGSATISMSGSVFVGLPVTSHNNSSLCTATFTDVIVNNGSQQQQLVIETTNQQEEEGVEQGAVFSFHPNPVQDNILHLEADVTPGASVRIVIVNLFGHVVYEHEVTGLPSGKISYEIDLSGVPRGTYFIKLLSANEKQSASVILR